MQEKARRKLLTMQHTASGSTQVQLTRQMGMSCPEDGGAVSRQTMNDCCLQMLYLQLLGTQLNQI